jgi:hypothetical protein
MSKNIINEELKRFNDLLGYDPVKGVKLTEAKTRRTYLAEADPEEGGEEENSDFSVIKELIKRENNGDVLNNDEIYILHTYFYKNHKEFRDKYNDFIDKLIKKKN